jgi:putative transcriptional regulator
MTKRYSEIGKRLLHLRGDKSQSQFAKEMGVTLRAYQYYESGERVPHIHLLSKIADANNTTIDWILTGKVDVARARLRESVKRNVYVEELIELLEKSLEREEKLINRYLKGHAGFNEKAIIHKEEKEFIEIIRSWINEESHSKHITHVTENNPIYRIYKKVERIFNEGDNIKLKIMDDLLTSLDPEKKKAASLSKKRAIKKKKKTNP